MTEELRGLGFSVTELAGLAEVPPAAFGGKEFDALVGDGVIRLGTPPTAAALAGRKEQQAPQGAEHATEPEPGPDDPRRASRPGATTAPAASARRSTSSASGSASPSRPPARPAGSCRCRRRAFRPGVVRP